MTAPGATCSRSRGDDGRDCWRSGTDEGNPGETPGPRVTGFRLPPLSGGAYELSEPQEGDRPGFRLLFLVQRFRSVVATGKEDESLPALGSLRARPVDRRRSLPPWCGDRRLHLEGLGHSRRDQPSDRLLGLVLDLAAEGFDPRQESDGSSGGGPPNR